MRYRIALCGFSEFEYRAMHFSFQHPAGFEESLYDVVDALSDADFAVVDANSQPAVKGVLQSGRVAQTVFVGDAAPAGAASHLRRPIDPTRILRTLDELTRRPSAAAARPRRTAAAAPPGNVPTLHDVVVLPHAAIEAAAVVPPSPATPPSSQSAKAAARAKARARLASSRSVPAHAAEPLREVLVLDDDAVASGLLCALLERFGFDPKAVTVPAHATAQLALRPFAAVFLSVALDDAGVALVQQIRSLPEPWPHPAPAVLMVAGHRDPTDRVRATLAGLPEPLVKPLGRGDVARALERVGVPLPADARRH